VVIDTVVDNTEQAISDYRNSSSLYRAFRPLKVQWSGLGRSPLHAARVRIMTSLCMSRAKGLAEVTVSKDVPGFISNALLMPFINEVSIRVLSSAGADHHEGHHVLGKGTQPLCQKECTKFTLLYREWELEMILIRH
jgi:hypothetical protein